MFYEPPIGDVLFEYNLTKISNIDLKITLSYLGGEKKIEVTGTGPRYITTTVKIYSDSDQDKQVTIKEQKCYQIQHLKFNYVKQSQLSIL